MNTRIIKKNNKYYCQYLKHYRNIFFQKKHKWCYFKKWCEGSLYPPYSADTYEPYSFSSIEEAKEELHKIIDVHSENHVKVVYEHPKTLKTNPHLHSDEWDMGIPK